MAIKKLIKKEDKPEIKVVVEEKVAEPAVKVKSHKQELLELYENLQKLGVKSIGDLEVLISRAE